MRNFPTRSVVIAAPLVLGLAAACGEPLGLPRASVENVVDTVSLYALSGTPVATPSGYRIQFIPTPVRTDLTTVFDFAFDIDTLGRAVLLPTGALRLGRLSGGQLSEEPFDSIKVAPNSNYQLDSAIVVESGSVVVLHSRPTDCGFALTPGFHFFAKLHVLAIDPTARTINFEILVDQNCGYRGLEPGLPRR
jgi:hypothetical protein